MKVIISKIINHKGVNISLDNGELKASLIGGKQIQLIGMCGYDKTLPDLSQRLITILNQSQYKLEDGILKITPHYKPTTELPTELAQTLASVYLNDPSLTTLNLSYNGIDDVGAVALAKAFSRPDFNTHLYQKQRRKKINSQPIWNQ